MTRAAVGWYVRLYEERWHDKSLSELDLCHDSGSSLPLPAATHRIGVAWVVVDDHSVLILVPPDSRMW